MATLRLKVMALRRHSPIRRDKWLRENAEAIAEYNAALQAGLPELDFAPLAGRGKRRYVAAIHAAMGRDYKPLQGLFRRAIDRTVASNRR